MMRKLLLTLVWMALALAVRAQDGLSIKPLLEGRSAVGTPVTKLVIKGKRLTPYKLTKYRSITYETNPLVVKDLEKAVMADSRKAYDKEIGHLDGRLYYAFLCLSSKDENLRRYVFYRNATLVSGGKREATLVYMEGQVTMDELKKIFK